MKSQNNQDFGNTKIQLLPMMDSTYIGYKMDRHHEIPTKIARMILVAKCGTQDNYKHFSNFTF